MVERYLSLMSYLSDFEAFYVPLPDQLFFICGEQAGNHEVGSESLYGIDQCVLYKWPDKKVCMAFFRVHSQLINGNLFPADSVLKKKQLSQL
ncbi:hypothetical protein ACM36E_000722 [Cronobacter sakazakii]|uniref:hypothetical protein n=1 Tax=Cronobacter sakazakii TaxID=28141 RepID=UPI000D022274|nr:hypothetical protein [Cronobacter sakazakii]ELY2811113.1 hypothetical protein [Cronobacter sakazakii]ELY5888692.1 hypothetical protein [Cronobacter sakazakii]ELY6218788.1 hypothetical protein [Cronobacter sakazakii]QWR93603.1 hypothetical protein G4U59_11750 [Cronobacter sakazakii]